MLMDFPEKRSGVGVPPDWWTHFPEEEKVPTNPGELQGNAGHSRLLGLKPTDQ